MVDMSARVPDTARVWGYAQIREFVVLGERVVVGSGAYVGKAVVVGDDSKIQDHALVYEPAILGRGVFVGPGAVLTNDRFPRAVTPTMRQVTENDWTLVGVTVQDGASIGAGAICVAPLRIGLWAMIAAGSVVTKDVADHALVAGNPARQIGWVGRAGIRLQQVPELSNLLQCPGTGDLYEILPTGLRLLGDVGDSPRS